VGKKYSDIAMTTDEFNKKLEEKIKLIEKENIPLERAVRHIMTLQSRRIFINAKNANESPIGTYKDRELYINPNKEPQNRVKKFPVKGKTGETKFKNGEPHKTGYFSNWLSYKKTIGQNKNTNGVNLSWTGDLQRNWANADIGKPANAIRINQHNYVVSLRKENAVKAERYGNVFGISTKERVEFFRVNKLELIKALK
jgi:hypothetical protein